MDWLRSDPYISDRDTKVLKFKPGYNKVLLVSKGNQERNTLHETWELKNDIEWSEWLEEYEHDSVHWSDGVCVTLAGRADSIWQDHSVLSNMPFSRGIFNKITNMFWVHSSIVRVINRNTNAHCSAEVGAWGDRAPEAVVYNCRSAATWPGDLALCATYIPERRFTFAILYGCDAKISEDVIGKLQINSERVMHPMTLPLLFADVERDRHANLVSGFHTMLMQRACEFKNESGRATETSERLSSTSSTTLTEEKPTEGLLNPERDSDKMFQWMDLCHLRNGLQNWKAQLQRLAEHQLSELGGVYRFPSAPLNNKTPKQEHFLVGLAKQSTQIQARLQQLLLEYEEKIRVSSLVIDGMNFATQVEWNYIARRDIKTNLDIAKSTMETTSWTVEISKAAQRDSSHMRSIAVLTMAFLPGTFVATVFSMNFFDWQGGAEGILSPYIWIFVVVVFRIDRFDLGNMAILDCFGGYTQD
ncbi:hypothetical protein PG987_009197 [Apiospora arundinis]